MSDTPMRLWRVYENDTEGIHILRGDRIVCEHIENAALATLILRRLEGGTMSELQKIKVLRAIKRLASAVMPGTDAGQAGLLIKEAIELLTSQLWPTDE